MRAIALLAALSSLAIAEPPPKPVTLPDAAKEATDAARAKPAAPHGTPGIKGGIALGIVIEPPAHPDAKTVDQGGSILIPPDVNDAMALIPGTNQIRDHVKLEPWLPRDLSRSVKAGADHVWDFLLPEL